MLKPDIRNLQRGDSFSWDCAYHWLWPAAYSAAFHRLEKIAPNEVEDIAITAIREAAEVVAKGKVASLDDLVGLVREIARRRALDLIRRLQAKQRSTELTESVEGREEILVSAELGPMERADANDVSRLLSGLMRKLSPEEHALLRACYLRGMKQKEIADTFGIPQGTVGVKLSRALKKLREEIKNNPELLKEFQEVLR
jgi:RNA polymerase sigma factor (sigma-70 family)